MAPPAQSAMAGFFCLWQRASFSWGRSAAVIGVKKSPIWGSCDTSDIRSMGLRAFFVLVVLTLPGMNKTSEKPTKKDWMILCGLGAIPILVVLSPIWFPFVSNSPSRLLNTLYRSVNGEEFVRDKCARKDSSALGVPYYELSEYCDNYFGYKSPHVK